MEEIEPKLQPPGAGLPVIEWALARYIFFPKLFKERDKDTALLRFQEETRKILDLAGSLSPKSLGVRRLVPRLQGLEDNSRFWSVAMVLQHLVIVGDVMCGIIVDLSSGGTNRAPVGIIDVKPRPTVDITTAIPSFEQMADRFVHEVQLCDVNAFPKATYPHPWFGALNAHKWLVFAAPHQAVHRNQIKQIIKQLPEAYASEN